MLLIELRENEIVLPDLESEDSEINLFLGADLISTLFTYKCMKLNYLLETRLICVLDGKTNQNVNSNYDTNIVLSVVPVNVKNSFVDELCDFETIGIKGPVESLKNPHEHSKIREGFKNNVKIHSDGRSEVCLPFKSDTYELPSNKEMTWKRYKKNVRMHRKGGRGSSH